MSGSRYPESGILLSAAAGAGSTGRPRATMAAAALVVAAFGAAAGLAGLAAGLLTAAVWYRLGTPYAVAAGHVALVGLFPAGVDTVSLGLVWTALLALVIAPILGRRGWSVAAATVTTALGLGALAWLLVERGSIPIAAAGVLAATGLVAYALHRYERVSLGLVAGAGRTNDATTGRASGSSSRRASGPGPGRSAGSGPGRSAGSGPGRSAGSGPDRDRSTEGRP